MTRVLVTGAGGQIGSELVPALREKYEGDAVLATDIRPTPQLGEEGPFERLDVTDAGAVRETVERFGADTVFHMAAVLSAVGETDPQRAYRVNMDGLVSVLEAARRSGAAVFVPSSIAAFGPSTPGDPTPQETVQRPTTMYGVTKVAGELLCDYYHTRYAVDTRGVRYPGIVSHVTNPGGGTTDWAVSIFHEAVDSGRYTCFLAPDAALDMMYMPDAVRAAIELMEADGERLAHRNAYNITAMQLAPRDLAELIARELPGFEILYDVDPVRQAIADSWPRRLDDSAARREWDWSPRYDAERMTIEMLENVRRKHAGANRDE